MSKIVLISQTLGTQTCALAQALRIQRHEVIHVTSKNETPPLSWSEPALTYFEKWSAWEAVRLFPRLLSIGGDIFHFVFEEEQRLSFAHLILAQLCRALPHKIIVSSFFESRPQRPRLWPVGYMEPFLNTLDVVTFPTQERLMWNRRNLKLKPTLLSEILPPLPNLTSPSSEELQLTPGFEELAEFCKKLGPYLLVPTSQEVFAAENLDLSFLKPQTRLAFWGARQARSDLSYFTFGHLNEVEKLYSVEKAQGLLLAFSDFSAIELQRFLEMSIETGTPLLIRPSQLRLVPGLVRDRKTGFVLEKGTLSLMMLMEENPDLVVPQRSQHNDLQSLTDSCLNDLNRLYTKAFTLRWS